MFLNKDSAYFMLAAIFLVKKALEVDRFQKLVG
jgi:hypothetical protein